MRRWYIPKEWDDPIVQLELSIKMDILAYGKLVIGQRYIDEQLWKSGGI